MQPIDASSPVRPPTASRGLSLLLLAATLLILPACGQKGPLFLSDPAAPGKPPPAGATAAVPDKSPEKK